MSKQLEQKKIHLLAKEYGYESGEDLALEYGFSSIVPAICMTDNCNEVYGYEPDSVNGWCSKCNQKKVQSILVLTGLI